MFTIDILTRNDYDGHYDSGFSTDMMARIVEDIRSKGLSDANVFYFLFLGYLEYMKNLGEEVDPNRIA